MLLGGVKKKGAKFPLRLSSPQHWSLKHLQESPCVRASNYSSVAAN